MKVKCACVRGEVMGESMEARVMGRKGKTGREGDEKGREERVGGVDE